MSLIRRIAGLLFIMAFLASAQVQAAAPVSMSMPKAIGAGGMMGMTKSNAGGTCKGCGKSGTSASTDCAAACAPIQAIAEELYHQRPVARDRTWSWTSEPGSTRSTVPDPTPPRS